MQGTIVKVTSSGTLDTAFASNGVLTLSDPECHATTASAFRAVHVDADGRLVVAGHCGDPGDPTQKVGVVMRYLANGSPDPAFGGAITVGSSGDTVLNAVGVSAAGDIVVAGETATATKWIAGRIGPDQNVAYMHAFAMGGPGSGQAAHALFVSGASWFVGGRTQSLAAALVKLDLDDGDKDPSFSGDGELTIAFAVETTSGVYGLAPSGDGRLLVTGHSFNGSHYAGLAVVKTADGTLDASFGMSGTATAGFLGTMPASAPAVVTAGGIYLAIQGNSMPKDFLALKVNAATGVMVTEFGALGGLAKVGVLDDDLTRAVARAGDGGILIGGDAMATLSVTREWVVTKVYP